MKRPIGLFAVLCLVLPISSALAVEHNTARSDDSAGRWSAPGVAMELASTPAPQTFKGSQTETYPFGIDLLICLVSARLNGSNVVEAMGQCSASEEVP